MVFLRAAPAVASRRHEAMPAHIKLYGSKSDRFETIKLELTEALGYEPSNPEVVGILMARYGAGEGREPTTPATGWSRD